MPNLIDMLRFSFFLSVFCVHTVVLVAQDFRVQIAAFSEPVNKSYFEDRGVSSAVLSTDQMGMNRYFLGTYATRETAERVQEQLVEKGFPFATVIDLEVQRLLFGSNCPYFKGSGPVYIKPESASQGNSVYFESGKIRLSEDGKQLLDRIAREMASSTTSKLHILGHSDGSGDAKTNAELATDRSRVVRNYLIGKGVRADRMFINVYGESNPIAPNNDPFTGEEIKENLAWNRRVELVVLQEGAHAPVR
jgi:outer membrane protein OmpA-like peptidoglycan-associated protein